MEDVLQVMNVFVARMNGMRKYTAKKNIMIDLYTLFQRFSWYFLIL